MDHDNKVPAATVDGSTEDPSADAAPEERDDESRDTTKRGAGHARSADGGKNKKKKKGGARPNNVRRARIERMMSKAELARRANLSVLTIDRVEKGYGCRMDTKRKILEALGLSLAERVRVFGEEE